MTIINESGLYALIRQRLTFKNADNETVHPTMRYDSISMRYTAISLRYTAIS